MRTLLPKSINHSVSPGGGVVPSTVLVLTQMKGGKKF